MQLWEGIQTIRVFNFSRFRRCILLLWNTWRVGHRRRKSVASTRQIDRRMKNGHRLYLSLIADAFSRMVVGYHVADTLEAVETAKALQMAMMMHRRRSPISYPSDGIRAARHEVILAFGPLQEGFTINAKRSHNERRQRRSNVRLPQVRGRDCVRPVDWQASSGPAWESCSMSRDNCKVPRAF